MKDQDSYFNGRDNKNRYTQFGYRCLRTVFFQVSEILNFFFSRLCGEWEPLQMQYTQVVPPPITVPTEQKKHKYQPESSVEEFLVSVIKKIDHEEMEPEVNKIVAMLKGNWYTTVADLRALTEADAEKLNIPRRLFVAIQEELPREGLNFIRDEIDEFRKSGCIHSTRFTHEDCKEGELLHYIQLHVRRLSSRLFSV